MLRGASLHRGATGKTMATRLRPTMALIYPPNRIERGLRVQRVNAAQATVEPVPGPELADPPTVARSMHPSPEPSSSSAPSQGSGSSISLTFQQAISKLQAYWAERGCMLWLPHNTEVGAGTMNPATFLRVTGPEPWSVAYVEPSIRPDDSRYGDNPNRLQRHTQFQVILKPDPGNSQELFLGSLEALGIDTRAHDVRFVEDNWESPVLGAWGLGWEVWLDGMEVTQFTYFQQAGGATLEHPAVEITYGMERIMMSLQGVTNFKDIRYNETLTYGELFLQNEYEMSVYNMDEADVADQRARFELFEREARRLVARRLPVPAYDHLLKLSHTFNILDARGAVGVTERANCFAVMRNLAREITGLWLSRREELGHPLGLVAPPAPPNPTPAPPSGTSRAEVGSEAAQHSFVLEIGTEELPPEEVQSCVQQLRQRVGPLLQQLRLQHGTIRCEATPRRLAVLVEDLATAQTSAESQVRGPPWKQAFTASGQPSPALLGFCKKNGVDPAEVTKAADNKGVEYVYACVKEVGRPAAQVLAEALPGLLLDKLALKKSMRWRGPATFSRPVRWLLALHGPSVVPLCWAGLAGGAATRVLRSALQPLVQVHAAEAYLPSLAAADITLSCEERQQQIWDAVSSAARQAGGLVPAESTAELLAEVSCLVESPNVILGSFNPSFLQLPQEVLVMVMRKHQRYFPVFASDAPDAALLPCFITVANGPVDREVVAAGNAAVLKARFQDAAFFYQEDLKQPLDDLRLKLAGSLFYKGWGSLLDKSDRVKGLVAPLADATGWAALHQGVVAVAERAAHLATADLASSTVTEMTALAGVMGRHYAYKQGEAPEVAEAIFEAALPRNAGDKLPASPAGVLVAVADRLDTLVGLMGAGCTPSAAADPNGLRRAANGLVQTLLHNKVPLSLTHAVAFTAAAQPAPVTQEQQAAVVQFLQGRLQQIISDSGVKTEIVRAVLAERGDNPYFAATTASDLAAAWDAGEDSALRRVMAIFARPTRIVRDKAVDPAWTVDPAKFELPEETALHAAVNAAASQLSQKGSAPVTVADFLAACEPMAAPMQAYFDKVFVMCEDQQVQRNRLAFLRDTAGLISGFADLSKLPGF
ncbi:glycyl-tRNA synthetase beta subunit-domain-containing protein [Haematococcus lacustris]